MAKGSFKPARVWAGFRRTIQVHVVHPCPSPRLTTPDKTSEHECVFLPFSSFSTLLQVQRATHYLIRFHFTSTSNLGLKNYLHHSWMSLWDLLGIIWTSIWAKPYNSNNLPPDLKVLSRIFFAPTFVLYTSVSMKIAKLNFHIEQ
jgi:hypothetical protein